MAAAYSLQLVNFQVMNYTYIFRSSIGCSSPTEWSVGARIILLSCNCVFVFKFVFVFSGLRLLRSTCAIDRGAKTRIDCRIKDICDRHFGIAAVH